MRLVIPFLLACFVVLPTSSHAQEGWRRGILGRIVEVGVGAQYSAYCYFSGCTDVSVLSKYFDPMNTKAHTCRQIFFGGPASVEMWVCLVEDGGVISATGDLIAVVVNRTGKPAEITSNCYSEILPSMDFRFKRFAGWGDMLNSVGHTKNHGHYIIEPGLSIADRDSWRRYSNNVCTWSIDFKKPEPEPKAVPANPTNTSMSTEPQCPMFETLDKKSGKCEPLLKAHIEYR